MSRIEQIKTKNAPDAVGPYSQAVKAGGFLFASGQIALVPETGAMAEGGIEKQTLQVMENLKAVLQEAGCGFSDVVRCDIFITSMKNFPVINEIYASYFEGECKPARQTVEVASLPKGAEVEISCIAVL